MNGVVSKDKDRRIFAIPTDGISSDITLTFQRVLKESEMSAAKNVKFTKNGAVSETSFRITPHSAKMLIGVLECYLEVFNQNKQ